MTKMSRREFVAATAAGALVGGATRPTTRSANSRPSGPVSPTEQVALGKTGIRLSRIGIGTGTHGFHHQSDQTRLGRAKCVDLLLYAYERGITYFDLADVYGSHGVMREALKKIPRDRVTLLTKMWNPTGSRAAQDLDRFRKELDTDTIDIVLLHCQTDGAWTTKLADAMKTLAEARRKGRIRAHGCSCHSLDALRTAAETEWVQVCLARINPYGAKMDGKPEQVLPALQRMARSGKGVLGMKIFGEGTFKSAQQRTESLRFVLAQRCVHAMTIGFLAREQIDEVLSRAAAILSAQRR